MKGDSKIRLNLSSNEKKRIKRLLLGEISKYLVEAIGNGSSGICMSASLIVSRCLNAFGILCIPVTCQIMFINQKAQKILAEKGSDFLLEELARTKNSNDDSLWSIGIGFTNNDSDFHAVILFSNGSVMDLTALQASRPTRDMIIKNYWAEKRFPSYVFHFKRTYKRAPSAAQKMSNLKDVVIHVMNRIEDILKRKPTLSVDKVVKSILSWNQKI